MNRMILLESLLALAALTLFGPGSPLLVELAAKQAVALTRRKSH